MHWLFRRAAPFAVLLCTVALSCAEAQDLTLRDAVERALERNPELQSFQFRLQAQDARVRGAGLRPAFEVRTEIENVAGTGEMSGVDAAEATIALSRVIELGDKRGRRIEAAQVATELLQVEQRAKQLDVVAEVTRRFLHVASDQEHLQLTRRALELAQRTVEAAERRVGAGRAPEVELNRARIALARALIEQQHAERELLASRRKLAATWGDTEDRFEKVSAQLFQLPAVPDFAALSSQLITNPELLRFASEARLRDAEVRVAQSRRRPDVLLSAGVRRLQTTDDQALVLGFNVPLFSGARAEPEIAEARARVLESKAEMDAHRVRVLAQLFEIYQELRDSVSEADTLRQQVVPQMEAALKATEYAFERGRYSYLEWVEAQRELIALQRALIDASTNAHLFHIEIERLTGTAIPGAAEISP